MDHSTILPCPTSEGESVYLNGFSDGPKPYEEVLTFLRKGTEMVKYGRLGAPKAHPFRLSNDMQELQWESKKGSIRRIPLKSITGWARGQTTPVFKKYPQPQVEDISFSIFYKDESKRPRTLDVVCRSKQEFEMWFWGVQIITHYPPSSRFAAPPAFPAPSPHSLSSSVSAPVAPMQRSAPQSPAPPLMFNARAAPPAEDRRPKAAPKTKPMAGLNLVVNSMRSSGTSTGGPPTNHRGREMGDLYVWGSLMVADADESAANPSNPASKEESLRDYMTSKGPTLVHNATSVDVMRVACAPRHAALITRNGELYTWGYGKDGNLGHGWCSNFASPRLLTRMGGRGVRAVSCGEGASAAISSDQRLFMWGKAMAGQLGNGYAFPCAEPAPVRFPGLKDDVKVLAVSCGPYHTAAITEGGLLFTWGDGLFGKLGHGSHRSEYRPRKVADLEDKYVFNVSCGYWHTAAVAAPRNGSRNGDASTPASTPGAQPPPQRQLTMTTAASMSAIPAQGEGVGGEDGGRGPSRNIRVRSRTFDMSSSSGSDLQGSVAAAAANITSSRNPVTSSHGGGEVSGAHGGHHHAGGGSTRGGDDMSCSVASLDKLQDVASEDQSASPSGSAGALYTWGCDFSWVEGTKPDHHHGCLGTGDTEGRLVPTRVRGDMDKYGVVQVACGWSMTVALSGDGRVYQMGKTGAHPSSDKNCMWEGALSPTRVDGNLFGMFVEEVACGVRHVVVVASRVQANGQIPDDQRRVRLLTWGCGAEGQLGLWGMTTSTDAPVAVRAQQTDYHLPQIVGSLDGRRVLHIAAGGNLTMAVMEHDPRTRRSNPGPITASTPTNPFGGSAAATPSGGGGIQSQRQSYAQYQSMVSAAVRDVGTAAAFQLSQSLPLAAGLQSLQQMVSGSVGTRSKAATPTGGGADGAHVVRGVRRPKRLVGIPPVTVGQPRSDNHHHHHHHRSDLRRSASRGPQGHFLSSSLGHMSSKALSMAAREGKAMDPAASVSSDVVSHRSSPPQGQPSEDADSRSASPTSSSLYEMSSATGDLQPSRRAGRDAALDAARQRACSVDVAAMDAALAAAAAAAASASAFGRPVQRRGSSGNAAEAQSVGENSAGDMPETDTDSCALGGRSLDMVPEQSEESPGLTSPTSRRTTATAHQGATEHQAIATSTAAGPQAGGSGGGAHLHPYAVEGHEVVSAMTTQVTSPMATPPAAAMQPRLSRLAQQTPGRGAAATDGAATSAVADGGFGEAGRSSVSTVDSLYTVEGSASSELSPSGIGTPSPETPPDGGDSGPGRAAGTGIAARQLPYTIPEELPSSPPAPQQQQLPFAASHHVASSSQHPHAHPNYQQQHPHHQQQPSALQAGAMPPPPPARHASLGSAMPAHMASGGAGPSVPGGMGRNREISISMWAQPPGMGPSGSAHGSFRSDGSMRTGYGVHPDGAAATAAAGGGGGGGGLRSTNSRGSRGHSRHASYDSLEVGSREGDQRVSNGFDARPPSFAMHAGGGSGNGMAAMRGPAAAAADPMATNLALMQQNDFLQKQVEKLMQQVTMLSKAAELSAAMASVGGHTYPPPPAAVAPQQQASAAASAAAAAAAAAVHGTPQAVAAAAVAAAAGLPPYPGPAVAPPPVHFGDAAGVGHGSGNGGVASVLSPKSSQAPLLHHAFSAGAPSMAAGAAVTSPGHGGFSGMSSGSATAWGPATASIPPIADRQGSVAGGPPPPLVPTAGRHKRSSSIDVSSLIATRDGIGPAKDYLAPAGGAAGTVPSGAGPGPGHHHLHPHHQQHQPQHHLGERVPSLTREGSAMGHHSAPPALETLRQAHPGMSLAQAALREEDEEGFEEDVEDDDEEEEDEAEADMGEIEPALDDSLGAVTISAALPLASQGSLHRQLYVSQQQPPPQQQQQQQPGPGRRASVPQMGHVFEQQQQQQPSEPSLGSMAAVAKDGFPRPTSENSYRSSTSGDGTVDTSATLDAPGPGLGLGLGLLQLPTATRESEGGQAGGIGVARANPLWRSRRNAFVEWANSMHHEMTEENPMGSGGGAAPGGGGGVASGGPSGEDSFSGGSVALAPAAESLPPDGKVFQYSPGVFITLKPPAQKGERIELVKIRFHRRFFEKQADGQAWWNANKAALSEMYKVLATATGSAQPAAGLPPLAPGGPQPGGSHAALPAGASGAMHTRGLSSDTQATSAGSTVASGGSMYFSVPINSSPVHGLTGAGSGGSAVSSSTAAAAAAAPPGTST
ncbi:hypothetical protein PLESTF_001536100 [Pleodorina starrii]|nr:hypothetical protein PLESTF_001536100 [Pleodorina starrii]